MAVVRSPAAVVGKRAASSGDVVVGILGPEVGNAAADAVVDVVVVAVAETYKIVTCVYRLYYITDNSEKIVKRNRETKWN